VPPRRDALRLETYIQDAERDGDTELADFFVGHRASFAKAAKRETSAAG